MTNFRGGSIQNIGRENSMANIEQDLRSPVREATVPQGTIDEINSIVVPELKTRPMTRVEPEPPIQFTKFEDLNPTGKQLVNFQRTALSEAGIKILGVRETHTSGKPTELEIFLPGDRRADVIGGKLHKVEENGQTKVETVVKRLY